MDDKKENGFCETEKDFQALIARDKELQKEENQKKAKNNVFEKEWQYIVNLICEIQEFKKTNGDWNSIIFKYNNPESEKNWIEPLIKKFNKILFSKEELIHPNVENNTIRNIHSYCNGSILKDFSFGKIENLKTEIETFMDFKKNRFKNIMQSLSWKGDHYQFEKLLYILKEKYFELKNNKFISKMKEQPAKNIVSLIFALYEIDLIEQPFRIDKKNVKKFIYEKYIIIFECKKRSMETHAQNIINPQKHTDAEMVRTFKRLFEEKKLVPEKTSA